MVVNASHEPFMVPLMIEGVIVGSVSLGDADELVGTITNPSSESYLKELLLSGLAEGISLIVHYTGEPYSHVPEPGEQGNLRLI